MVIKKVFIIALTANAITACSSPPKLTEPDGDWISFDISQFQKITSQEVKIRNPSAKDMVNPNPSSVSDKNKIGSLPTSSTSTMPMLVKSDDKYAHKVSVPVKTLYQQSVQPTSITAAVKANTVTVLKTPLVPKVTEGTKPVMSDKFTQQVKLDPVIKIAPLAKPAPIFKSWTIEKGKTLKAGYMTWISKENCPMGGDKDKWSVRWETDTDYPIDYPLSFSAQNLEDATSQLFNLYRKAQAPLYVSGYRNQCLIIISDRK